MSKTPMTWGDLVLDANNHAVEYDCEVVIETARSDDLIQIGAAPVRLSLRFEPLSEGDGPCRPAAVLATQVAVVDGVAILRLEDQETGSVSLVGARGVDLFRILYV